MNSHDEILSMVVTEAIEPDTSPLSDWSIANRKSQIGNSPAWFFGDPARAAQFRAIWTSWDRTPFREHSRAKGPLGGIDCVAIQEETFFEVGAVPRFQFPRSDSDYKGHLHNTKLLSFLEGTHEDPQSAVLASYFCKLTNLDELVPTPTWPPGPKGPVTSTGLMTGDLAVIKSMIPGVWHLAAMQDDRTFKHCAYPLGVTEGDITQREYRDQLKAVFRCRAVPLPAPDHDPTPDLS